MIQRFKKTTSGDIMASNYFFIVAALNDVTLTPLENKVLSFISKKGGITHNAAKQEFCNIHNTTVNTLGNILRKLRKKNFLIKENGKFKINTSLISSFNENFLLQIKFIYE